MLPDNDGGRASTETRPASAPNDPPQGNSAASIVPPSPAECEALDVARLLISQGARIFAAPPALDADGNWDPAAGVGGYLLPMHWQKTVPTTKWLDPSVPGYQDKAWRPGFALCMVTGGPYDAVDADPRNGSDASLEQLAPVLPTVYAEVRTPSGGTHQFIAPLGVGSRDGFLPGVDLKGGKPDGSSRGFIFLAPTRKMSKVTGAVASYGWITCPPAVLPTNDQSGASLAALVRPSPRTTLPPRSVAPSVLDDAAQQRARTWTAAALEGLQRELQDAHAWPEGYTDERGRGWQKISADAALRLGSLARADWCPLTLEEAERLFLEAAPAAPSYDLGTIWRAQSSRGAVAAYPAERVDLATDVASWATEPGTRVDPVLAHGDAPSSEPQAAGAEQFTDAHLADRAAADVLAGRFCWSGALGWLQFDGRRWARSDEAAATDAVRRWLIDWHRTEALTGADSTRLKILSGLLSRNRIGAVVSLARGVVRIDATSLDSHPDLLNVGNGVVDLRTGRLQPHDPALLLTKVTPVDYTPGAGHDDWTAALEALPSDVAAYVQTRLGQAASGYPPPDDILATFTGAGANGKSTVTAAVVKTLGDHATVLSERALFGDPSQHPTELMPLRGARLAVIEELPEGGRLNVKRLKDAVGTPTMTARGIRQDPVTWETTHTLVLTTNYVPQVNEVDHGTWRRQALIRFPYTFVPPGQALTGPTMRHGQPGLRDRLLAGGDGRHEAVLAWLVEGARRWYAAERVMPSMPDVVRADTDAWRGEADRIHAYFGERLVVDPQAHVVAVDLFGDFSEWLQSHGYAGWSDQTFAGRFASHELVSKRDIQKRRVSASAPPSRRPGTLPATLAARYMAWTGVRFARPSDVPGQGWQGSPGDSHVGASCGTSQTTPATPGSDAWQPFAQDAA